MTTILELHCFCCARPFYPRTEFGGSGACCSGSGEYCVNCLKCARHCTCRGPLVKGYAAAWNAKHGVEAVDTAGEKE